jgi:N-acetylglucosaminyldiphosphoundecaprenol N-acetyl-beta-D-mannosaminyltransferase
MASPVRIPLLGMTVDALDLKDAAREVLRWCREPRSARCRFVVTPNVDHAVMFQALPALQHAYQRASLVLADGAPIVWASHWLGKPLPGRAAGSDLAPALFDEAAVGVQRDNLAPLRVFLLGAAPGVAERAARRIEAAWPGVAVVGTFSPPLGFQEYPAENQLILAKVAEAAPDLLVVGLGAPKQELWIDAHADRLEAKAALCIGATIDFLAGEKSRAPAGCSGAAWNGSIAWPASHGAWPGVIFATPGFSPNWCGATGGLPGGRRGKRLGGPDWHVPDGREPASCQSQGCQSQGCQPQGSQGQGPQAQSPHSGRCPKSGVRSARQPLHLQAKWSEL